VEDELQKQNLTLLQTIYDNPSTRRGLFKVRDSSVNLVYSLKRISGATNSEKLIGREVAALNRLPFGVAPHCHRIWSSGEATFLLMDWVDGETLSQRFTGLPQDKNEFVQRLKAVELTAFKLENLHRARIVHRDVKPDNILVNGSRGGIRGVHLVDFGLSIQARSEQEGTVGFRAPEQDLERQRNITAATDIFGLGQTAWQLFVGEPRSFRYNTDYTDWESEEPPMLPAFVPPNLIRELEKATAFDPGKRHGRAIAFAQALSSIGRSIK